MPLILLGLLALFGGMLRIPLASVSPALVHHESIFDFVSVIAVAAPFIGLLLAVLFYLNGSVSTQLLTDFSWVNQIRTFCFNGWGMDALYDYLLVRPFKSVANLNKNDAVDGFYLELAWLSRRLHSIASATQTGRVRWYASSLVLGAAVIIAIGLLS